LCWKRSRCAWRQRNAALNTQPSDARAWREQIALLVARAQGLEARLAKSSHISGKPVVE